MKSDKIKLLVVFVVLVAIMAFLFYKIETMRVQTENQYNQINDLQKENEELQSKIDAYDKFGGKLKPCPYCGSTNVEIVRGLYYQVSCNDCFFFAPVPLDESGSRIRETTELDAINLWNSLEISVDE
jgi:uncharacterized protein YxeA